MTTQVSASEAINRLLNPQRVAIVGASENVAKPSGLLFENIRNSAWTGEVLPVNPGHSEMAGIPAYRTVRDLPKGVDLAVVAVGPHDAEAVVGDCAAIRIPVVLVLSGGFGEGATGEVGRERARRLLETCRRHGTRVIGPNSVGAVNFGAHLPLTFADWYRADTGLRGGTAIVTQSGSVGGLAFRHLQRQGVGIRYWVGVGNELDLGVEDLIAAWVDDPGVERIVCYLEGVRDGRAFLRAASAFAAAGKRLIVLKAADTTAARRAAVSHTGKLASAQVLYDAAFRAAGAITTDSMEELAAVTHILADAERVPGGDRVGILSASGGICSLAASHAETAGLTVPQLGPEARKALAAVIPEHGSHDNPIDLSADVIARPAILEGTLTALAEDRSVDTWVVVGRPILERYRAVLADHAPRMAAPLILCTGVPAVPGAAAQDAIPGVAQLDDPELCMRAIARIAAAAPAPTWVDAPEAAAPPADLPPDPDLAAIRRSLEGAGVAFPRTWRVRDLAELEAGAAEMAAHGTLAVKTTSAAIPHRTEVGCVRTGVDGADALLLAGREILAAADRAAPGAAADGLEIQTMVPTGVEMLVSVYRDPDFGATLVVGAGGVTTELLDDVAVRLLPVTPDDVREMVSSLRVATVLRGYRGAPRADIEAFAALVGALGDWLLHDAASTGIELNPVIVGPRGQGASAVDLALVRTDTDVPR